MDTKTFGRSYPEHLYNYFIQPRHSSLWRESLWCISCLSSWIRTVYLFINWLKKSYTARRKQLRIINGPSSSLHHSLLSYDRDRPVRLCKVGLKQSCLLILFLWNVYCDKRKSPWMECSHFNVKDLNGSLSCNNIDNWLQGSVSAGIVIFYLRLIATFPTSLKKETSRLCMFRERSSFHLHYLASGCKIFYVFITVISRHTSHVSEEIVILFQPWGPYLSK